MPLPHECFPSEQQLKVIPEREGQGGKRQKQYCGITTQGLLLWYMHLDVIYVKEHDGTMIQCCSDHFNERIGFCRHLCQQLF